MTAPERQTLATSGALNLLAGSRRYALWESVRGHLEFDLFANAEARDMSADLLAPMTMVERIHADFSAVGLTGGDHPMKHLRAQFPDLWRADELPLAKNGMRVRVGGSVICRQRPGTAKGVVFVSLEDETGVANGILYPAIFEANRIVVTQSAALTLEGVVQSQDGVIHIKVEKIRSLKSETLPEQISHDFH